MGIPQIALILWIMVSIAMFAFLKPLKAFTLTYLIGMLILPVEMSNDFRGAIVFTQSVRLNKFTACHVGALLGIVMFAPHLLRRFRFYWIDLAFLGILVGQFATAMSVGTGPKDGFSQATDLFLFYGPLLLMSRMVYTTVGEVYELMRYLVGAAVLYSGVAVLEWRFSPQLHRLVYGYFQHSFDEFARYGHFRPIGFMRHAIELAFFMGSSAAMTGWMWAKGLLKKPLWGYMPAWAAMLCIMIGLGATMTFSGYVAFLLAGGMLTAMYFWKSRWLLWVLPAASMVWMAGRYTHTLDVSALLNAANSVDTEREDSLKYRLESEQTHLDATKERWLLGAGPEVRVTTDDGRGMAMDAWWMIQLTFYGVVGLATWYLVWCGAIFAAWWKWPRMTPDLRTVSAVVCVLLGIQFVDFLFNSFPSFFLMMLDVGVVSALAHYVPQRRPVGGMVRRNVQVAMEPAGMSGGAA